MKNKITVLFFLVSIFLVLSCKKDAVEKNDSVETQPESPIEQPDSPTEEKSSLSKIVGTNADNSFLDSDGNLFFPWGFNYTNVDKIGLIEDNWDTENTWDIITEDFGEMKAYTANIVRIHLQYHRFMIDKDSPDPIAFERLQRLVGIAEETGLYLDITGLAAYRKEDSPDWYDKLEDSERWATQALFWKSIAAAVGNSKAVFAYNLMNEPVVSVGCDGSNECDWLPGESFGGFHFVQNITRTPDLAFDIGIKDWIKTLTDAIRQADKTTMITVGFLGLGSLKRFEADLDYISLHTYPKSGELQKSVDYVNDNVSGKPLVLEEIFNLQCSIQELETFLKEIDGKYNGLMGHYYGKTPAELEASGTVGDALYKDFVEFIMTNNPN